MKRWVKVGRRVAIAISGMAVWVTEARGQTTSAPATLPQAVELQAILPNLASADFVRREAGQKELEKVPAARYAEVVALAAGQADPEVKARLDVRAGEMLQELSVKSTPESTQALIDLLSDKDGPARNWVIGTLTYRIGKSAEEGGDDAVIPALAKVVPDVKNESMREAVCRAASNTSVARDFAKRPDAKRVAQIVELLQERLKNDPSAEVRFYAACALAQFGDNTGMRELEKDALAMNAAGDEIFGLSAGSATNELPWVDALMPAMEKATGQKFAGKPVNPNDPAIMMYGDLWRQRTERKAKLEALTAWIKEHPATEPAPK